MALDEDISGALARVLARALPDFRSLDSVEQLTAGASQETYRLTLDTESGTRRLALRRSPPTIEQDSGVGGITLRTEARLLHLAVSNGIPGPAIVQVLAPEDGLGAGFIMEWLEGETLGQRINRADQFATVRPALARECGRILGRIHTLDWQAAGLEDELPLIEPGALVEETWNIYRELDVPVPMIDYTRRWLGNNLPRHSRVALVHGDFRNGNLMVTPQGISAVLDWELAQIGDPVRDLGWLCVNSWRFGHSELPVGGFGEVDDLLAGYRETSGYTVTPRELEFWQVFGSFWWSVVTLQMANAWRTGESPSLERPVIGRRSTEAQMDCVNLLIPGDYALPDLQRPLSSGTQLPMPAELLEGVVRFLKEEVATELQGRSAFLARVAANSLQIAQRELQFGSLLANEEKARLDSLLGTTDDLESQRRELVNRLRQALPLDAPGLAEHLRQTVATQLALDQPRYSALRDGDTR
jgi:aminoglycoside phosphotransferase (APT) family kinase protein